MAISYPLTLPAFRARNFTLGITPTVAVSASPFTGQQQVYEWPNVTWRASFDVVAKGRAEWSQLTAFMTSLRGRLGTVLIYPYQGVRPRGTTNTSGVTVATGGAAAQARAINLSGMGAARTLLAGDFLQLGTGATARLHMVVENATADGSGNATVTIEPPLRVAYSSGAAVTLVKPATVMRSVSNDGASTVDLGGIITASFAFSEAL
jgi:hypothetical protein